MVNYANFGSPQLARKWDPTLGTLYIVASRNLFTDSVSSDPTPEAIHKLNKARGS